jgi:hypothetical protein
MRTAMAVAVLVAGAASAEKMSAFGPGEQSTYSVSYLGVTAGTAQITVGATTRQWGKDVWPIVAKAQSENLVDVYPIRDKFVTYFEPGQQKTLGSDFYADENRKKRRQRIKLDQDAHVAEVTVRKEGSEESVKTEEIAADTLDIASVAFVLRNKELAEGKEYELPVYTGQKSFNLKATVEGKSVLETKLGKQEAWKVRVYTEFSGKLAAKRDIYAYFSADERHVPLKIEAEFLLGTIVAEISDYQPGKQVALSGSIAGDTGKGGGGR